MRNSVLIIIAVICLLSCDSDDEKVKSNLTGNQMVYQLYKGSQYNVSGTVTFKEMVSGNILVEIKLTGTQQGLTHPAHLHYEDIASNGKMAALLSPVEGGVGTSKTELSALKNSKPITYSELIKMKACVKVHLSDSGLEKKIVIAGGNIGSVKDKSNPFG